MCRFEFTGDVGDVVTPVTSDKWYQSNRSRAEVDRGEVPPLES